MENNGCLSYSPSQRSASSPGSYPIPNKNDIGEFIENYKPIDDEFNLKMITKSPTFQVVAYKKGLYVGEFSNKQREGKGVFITEKYIFEGVFKSGFKHFGS